MDRKDLVKKILELSLELKDAEGVQAMMCITDMENAVKDYEKQLRLYSVSNSFISVGEKEPPKHKELLVQSPDRQNYLASWRETYSIFTCQNKGEDSFDWKWREI